MLSTISIIFVYQNRNTSEPRHWLKHGRLITVHEWSCVPPSVSRFIFYIQPEFNGKKKTARCCPSRLFPSSSSHRTTALWEQRLAPIRRAPPFVVCRSEPSLSQDFCSSRSRCWEVHTAQCASCRCVVDLDCFSDELRRRCSSYHCRRLQGLDHWPSLNLASPTLMLGSKFSLRSSVLQFSLRSKYH